MNSTWIENRWNGFDWTQIGTVVLNSLLYIVTILVISRVAYGLIIYILRRMLLDHRGKRFLNERKSNTLFSLLRSMLFYLITFTVILHTLKHLFKFDTSTLLASASVLGVALGFGSQSLVKDIIGGFFILFEDQFSVGDYVQTGQFAGVVEETGIRATHLRDWGGELHIIPNGSITAVTNFSRGKMRALVDIQVPYDEDLDRAMKVMHSVCEIVGKEFSDKIIDPPTVQGVIQFGERNAVLRVIAFTQPNEQWSLERELRRQIHSAFLREGIRTPQQTVLLTDPMKR
ncbi:mechanosensitive ion channel family protein [Desulfosporosinus sp.]|uniref:mechanosensitive ion channel family protein n=1 Tax=Desulfosporosinus sp. TaxID=157907 RepID=UPI000E8A5D75|nr:mechanosensitive ion channel family protein [Desulfosporosinus sp.]MBC2722251.1 mechanosensitive ion channel family protein [Desulfosporosinus sp.]MBC2727909.1 mechanosensitive ion channel family protein [Desulfosporosinus sp.]HBV86657.1 mechanosensitive ion channel protein MscS [Desulfosporosinus sp.]